MFTKTTESYFFSVAVSTAVVCCVAFLLLTIGIGSQFVPTAHAEPTPTINYQGKLTDTNGLAVPDGTYNMRFWLLQSEAQATTSALWTESLTGSNKVQVTDGLFSIMLGSTSALTSVDFNQTLYLGVEIGGSTTPAWDGEMSPRKPLGTVPASFESYKLGGVASSSFVRSDVADLVSGLLTFAGGFVSSASSTITDLLFSRATGTTLVVTTLDVGGESFTSLTGTGLQNDSGVLTIATSSLNIAIDETTGTLAVARGGTGSTTPTGFLFGNGAGLLDSVNLITNSYIEDVYLRNDGDDTTSGKLTIGGDTNVSDPNSNLGGYFINSMPAVTGSTTLNNFFFAGASSTSFSSGANNYAFGEGALTNLLWGSNNVAIGKNALYASSTAATFFSDNNAFGEGALYAITAGVNNNALGKETLTANTTGSGNNALGYQALNYNITGGGNNAFGTWSMAFNTSGSDNNAMGVQSLYNNTTGTYNNAFGYEAMNNNTTGSNNNAFGQRALRNGNYSTYNNAFGYQTMLFNSVGAHNNALGYEALYSNTTGSRNNALGYHTLYNNNGTGTIAIGYQTADNATGVDRGIFIGYDIDAFSTTADDQLNIGNLIFGNNVNGTGQTISSGNIGIATTSSTARLTVQSTGTSDIFNLFETGGSEVFTVLESGNVGIGTSSPLRQTRRSR
ncbi:MAG: hypothetical protein H6782_02520 [Candidatus Nomurabacteria bacterium]|nr:MAG: hypothetical protein H6782_02520 [Candidatus Nomurabacteria bacterium]